MEHLSQKEIEELTDKNLKPKWVEFFYPLSCLHRLMFAKRDEELALAAFLNSLECAKKMAEEMENARQDQNPHSL